MSKEMNFLKTSTVGKCNDDDWSCIEKESNDDDWSCIEKNSNDDDWSCIEL